MVNNRIWFALVGVRPMENNDYIPDADGAYVDVACVATTEDEFISKLKKNFEHNRFEVFEIEDIETEDTLNVVNEENAEKITLMLEIKEGYNFAWGTFHTFNDQ